MNETTYTDTGFSRLLISCTNNYNGPRKGSIKFSTSFRGEIYQNGYPSSTSGCTQSISFTKSGGTESIVLNTSSSSTSLGYQYLSDFTSPTVNKIDNNNYSVTIGTNNTGSDLTGMVWFADAGNSYIGHTIITQSAEDTPVPTLTVNPTSLTYPASGGRLVLEVTYSGTLTTSEFPSWLTYQTDNVDSTHRSYTITASKNSSTSSRNFNLEISNGTDTVTVPITQSGAEAASLTISPNGASVGSAAGTTSVTVTSTGIDTVEYSIEEGWVSLKTQSSNVYTFSYTANTTSSRRSCIISFYGGGLSKSFVINQAAGAISVSPVSINVGSASGTIQVTVTGSSNITYTISDSWITYQSKSGNVYTFAYAQNRTSSQRTATVTFSAVGLDSVIFTLNQNGNGFDSIWFDRSFEPSSFQVGENYHYRLQDHNTNKIIYEGITVPVSEGEKPLGINIPRLVDSYIHSDELDDLREDMKLRTLKGSLSVDFYDMNGSTPSLVKTFNYWNDWSGPGYKTVYDITQSINDPINHKGCNYMVIPFCIYDDELSSYSVVETKKDDTQVSYPMGTPSDAFMYAAGEFFNAKSVSFKKGNDTLLTYDMDNCGEGFLLYKNRFGGWDSFLIEGNIYKYDEYTRLRGVYPKYPNGYGYSREKMTDRNTIKTRYEINTGWLTDEQAERLVFHLMSSTTVALRSFSDRTTSSFPYNMVSVSIVDSSVEYKKFKNGKKMINYTIKLEENDTKQVQR